MRSFYMLCTITTAAALCLGAAIVASAQQPPVEQALGTKLISEIQQGLQCNAGLIEAKAKIADLEAKLAAAQPKPELPK